jgi:hypothetical protein
MHQPLGLSDLQILALVLAITAVMLLVIPASRFWLVNLWMQMNGWIDARLLRNHHTELVISAVSRRISSITLRTEAIFSHWLRGRRSFFGWLGAAYNKSLAALEDARRKLSEEEQKALSVATITVADMPQFLPLGPAPYYLMQFVLGCGEGVLTFLAFQLWHLSPAALLVIVVLFALSGAAIGHCCGQAIYRRQVRQAIAIGSIGFLYCTLLGSMRFAWLAGHSESGGASIANFLSAFGWPCVFFAVSVVIGSQLRYVTDLEQAQLDEGRAEERSDALNQRGRAATKALRDQMLARKAHKTTLIDAYHRGFSFGWVKDPIGFPDKQIVVPESDLDELWPPARPSARPPLPPAKSTLALGNGSVSHSPVEQPGE